ncbi:MAG: hypothetical protein QOF98_2374, partial [Streptomyces sp.]|nr:hypothetical protein [Streptomyces sp.]
MPVPESTKGPGGDIAQVLLHGRIAHMESPAETADKPLSVSPLTSGGGRALLLTADGVRIEAEHLPVRGFSSGPEAGGSGQSRGLAIVIAHGFTGALERPAVRRAATHLNRYGGV